MQTTPAPADLTAAIKKTLTSEAFAKFIQQSVQTAVDELHAQPSAVVLQRPPTAMVVFEELENFRVFCAHSANYSREISMQCSRPGTKDVGKPGLWYGSESITAADGTVWSRQLGYHVQDDFGMLVQVAV